MAITREQVADEALTWLATPYVHQQSCKGVGVDCVGLLYGVCQSLGLMPGYVMPVYSTEWHIHNNQELLVEQLTQLGCTRITVEEAQPGDLLVMQYGRVSSHVGIKVPDNKIIHARVDVGSVVINDLAGELGRRTRSAWKIVGVE
jgi:NlpC/P60 family putative phage cell wall peptidase